MSPWAILAERLLGRRGAALVMTSIPDREVELQVSADNVAQNCAGNQIGQRIEVSGGTEKL